MGLRRRTARDIRAAKAEFTYARPFRARLDLAVPDSSIGIAIGNRKRKLGTFARYAMSKGVRFRSLHPTMDSTQSLMKRQVVIGRGRQDFLHMKKTILQNFGSRSLRPSNDKSRGAFGRGHQFMGNQYVKVGGFGRGIRAALRRNPRLSLPFRRKS
jgi:hypothetical protein